MKSREMTGSPLTLVENPLEFALLAVCLRRYPCLGSPNVTGSAEPRGGAFGGRGIVSRTPRCRARRTGYRHGSSDSSSVGACASMHCTRRNRSYSRSRRACDCARPSHSRSSCSCRLAGWSRLRCGAHHTRSRIAIAPCRAACGHARPRALDHQIYRREVTLWASCSFDLF